jgi:hypothetical protein
MPAPSGAPLRLGSRAGAPDITPRSANPKGLVVAPSVSVAVSECSDFAECGVMLTAAGSYPGTAVPLRCCFLINGTARRQARHERALFPLTKLSAIAHHRRSLARRLPVPIFSRRTFASGVTGGLTTYSARYSSSPSASRSACVASSVLNIVFSNTAGCARSKRAGCVAA